jgi:hypothetical protein
MKARIPSINIAVPPAKVVSPTVASAIPLQTPFMAVWVKLVTYGRIGPLIYVLGAETEQLSGESYLAARLYGAPLL